MATLFEQWIAVAQQIGVFRYILPFLLTFVVLYGVLERVSVFGGSRQSEINAVTAGVIGLFVTAFTPAGTTIGAFFSNVFGAIAVVLVGILLALVVVGLVLGDRFTGSPLAHALGGLGIAVLIAIFLAWGGLEIIFPGSGIGLPGLAFGEIAGFIVVAAAVVFLVWVLGEGSGD